MTLHPETSVADYELLVKSTRKITADESAAVVEHIQHSGQHPEYANPTRLIARNMPNIIRHHYAAILRGEITSDVLNPRLST
jgi:hypothetical protein